MLLSKDMSQIAIMRSVGLTSKNIKHQYMAGTLMVLILGIIVGVLASTYLGEFLVSMAMSSMGAAKIEFVQCCMADLAAMSVSTDYSRWIYYFCVL